ncbi:MAG: LptF/LptG family permease [Planctomycetota bacterium]
MTRLDRYVGRIAAGAFGVALLFFVFLTILVDLLQNASRYADRAAEQDLGGTELAIYLGIYYVNWVPVVVTTVTPFATVIACMFAVARLQHANEMVPMLFVGRSMQRVLRPMLLVGAVAAAGMATCWQWVMPIVGPTVASAEAFLRHGSDKQKHIVHERREHGEHFWVREFYPVEKRLVDVRLLVQTELAAETSLITAPAARWDDDRGDWRLEQGRLEQTRSGRPVEWLGRPDLTPAVLLQQSRESIDHEILSYTDLLQMVAARPNRPDIRFALHRHITWPLANLLLLLLVLPLAVHYERGSRIDRVLIAIGLCGGYLLMDLTCQSLCQKHLLHPVVAAWSPAIVFGSLGIVLFGSTRT